jgi:hypothetical protein
MERFSFFKLCSIFAFRICITARWIGYASIFIGSIILLNGCDTPTPLPPTLKLEKSVLGMDSTQVILYWGEPQKTKTTELGDRSWAYTNVRKAEIVFRNKIVTSIFAQDGTEFGLIGGSRDIVNKALGLPEKIHILPDEQSEIYTNADTFWNVIYHSDRVVALEIVALSPNPSIQFGQSMEKVEIGDREEDVIRKWGEPWLKGKPGGLIYTMQYLYGQGKTDGAGNKGVFFLNQFTPYNSVLFTEVYDGYLGTTAEGVGLGTTRQTVWRRLGMPTTQQAKDFWVADNYVFDKAVFRFFYLQKPSNIQQEATVMWLLMQDKQWQKDE